MEIHLGSGDFNLAAVAALRSSGKHSMTDCAVSLKVRPDLIVIWPPGAGALAASFGRNSRTGPRFKLSLATIAMTHFAPAQSWLNQPLD